MTLQPKEEPRCMICEVEFLHAGDPVNFKYVCECGVS